MIILLIYCFVGGVGGDFGGIDFFKFGVGVGMFEGDDEEELDDDMFFFEGEEEEVVKKDVFKVDDGKEVV